METLIQLAEKRLTESRDLKPGDIISQEFLDTNRGEESWTTRDIRLDRVLSSYLIYAYGGLSYLVPVVTLYGWDVRKGQGVRITCTNQSTWRTMRPAKQ